MSQAVVNARGRILTRSYRLTELQGRLRVVTALCDIMTSDVRAG